MDFDFTDDQEQLRDAVRRYVDKAYSFERRRKLVEASNQDPAAHQAAHQELAELGLSGLCIGSAFDGMDMGPVECMVVQEELGRGLVLEALSQNWASAVLIETYAGDALQKAWLPRLASGEVQMALAHQERGARYQLSACKAVCEQKSTPAGVEYRLNATKNVVFWAEQSSAFIVSAMLGQTLALFVVERGASGVQLQAYGCQDGSRAADLSLTNTPAQLLTLEGGLAALELATDVGIANTCAYAVGAMEKTMALTADYMNTRKQFGVPIATFQALRHRMADMKMQLELARSMSYLVTLKLGHPAPERRRAAAQAKYQLGQSMRFVGQQAVQLHGGIGVTDEYVISHYFKTLTQLEMRFGDSLNHLGEVSARMQASAGVFA